MPSDSFFTTHSWQKPADAFTTSFFPCRQARKEWVLRSQRTASAGEESGEEGWAGPFALWGYLVSLPCFICTVKPGWPRSACLLPSFLSSFSSERKSAFRDCQYRCRNEETTIHAYFTKGFKSMWTKKGSYLSISVFHLCWKSTHHLVTAASHIILWDRTFQEP